MTKTTKRETVKVEIKRATDSDGDLWLMIKWGVGGRGYVVTQHAMVAPSTYELTGRLLLGLDTDPAML